jgi:hypothetical protein
MGLNEEAAFGKKGHFRAECGGSYAKGMSFKQCSRPNWLCSFDIVMNNSLKNPLLSVVQSCSGFRL